MNAQQSPAENIKYISFRKLRQRRLAQMVLMGTTYAEIGRELYPNATYPAQTVYNCLQQPGAQREIRQLAAKHYDERELRERLNDILENPDSQRTLLRAIALGMRERGMLGNKRPETVVLRTEEPRSHLEIDELFKRLLENEGIEKAQ